MRSSTNQQNILIVEIEPHITFSGSLMFLRKQEEHIRELILSHATLLAINGLSLFTVETPGRKCNSVIRGRNITCDLFRQLYFPNVQFPGITEVFVNNRPIRIKYEHDSLLISTTRI